MVFDSLPDMEKCFFCCANNKIANISIAVATMLILGFFALMPDPGKCYEENGVVETFRIMVYITLGVSGVAFIIALLYGIALCCAEGILECSGKSFVILSLIILPIFHLIALIVAIVMVATQEICEAELPTILIAIPLNVIGIPVCIYLAMVANSYIRSPS